MTPADPNGGFVAMGTRPKWSVIAIVGFVLSFLFVLAPAGVLLGIVGIFRTTGGRRKGMGLAIAAIPIGLLVSVFSTGIVLAAIVMARVVTTGPDAMEFLAASRTSVPGLASDLYSECSDRFQVAVTNDAFQAWAVGVAEKHGTMQKLDASKMQIIPTDDQRFQLELPGQFVNGPAGIRITIGMSGMTPEIDDIEVDGVSAVGAPGDE